MLHTLPWRHLVYGLLTVFLLSAAPVCVFADTFSNEEIASLSQSAQSFEKAIATNDADQIAHGIPPKIWNFLIEKSKITDAQLLEGIKHSIQKSAEIVTIASFKMNVDHAVAKQLADGFRYTLIPTDTVLTIKGAGKKIVHAQTLAFVDEGKWYLVRISDPVQTAILKLVYPSFADVEFPKEVSENMKE